VSWPAPQDGEIVERVAVNGMRAAPGDVLFRIADHDVVWVLADVAERDLSLIELGQKASVRLRAYPNRVFTGNVTLIYPHLMRRPEPGGSESNCQIRTKCCGRTCMRT